VPTRCQDCAVLCQRGLVLCSVVPTRFSIVQCCAQRGLVLCQRGAKIIVQCCADEV